MKVVVINAYVRENAGDAALLSVCLRHVREAFPGADVSIAGMEEPERHAEFDGCRNIGSVLRYVADGAVSKRTRILRRVVVGVAAGIYATAPAAVGNLVKRFLPDEARREIQTLSKADLVVSMGGGYLNARPGLDGYQNVFFILLPALIAAKHRVPVVFAPQSYGPFPAAVQRLFVAATLRRAALVLSREDVSVEILTACGLPADRVIRAVDSGFAFDPPTSPHWRKRLGIDRTTRLVGMTARQWLPPQEQEKYERALAATVDYLHMRQVRVVLIPQVTTDYLGDDDRIVSRRIHAFATNKPLLVDEVVDYRVLKGLYGECDVLLGTRFHSVIFALTSRVPCIAIEYEHKTRGIMRDLGLEEWVLPIEDVTVERLRALIERLDEHRDRYLHQLRTELPSYVARAESFPESLRALYDSDTSVTVRR